jgi:hypothetical protein
VRIVREWGLLPPATVFVEDVVASRADRDWWCERAVAATTDADLVFLDPDNGLEVTSVGRRSATAPKYTYYSELMPYVQRPQSLIVYHHLGRRGTADEQIDGRLTELGACTNRQPFALRFRGGTARAYFVIPSSDAGERLRRRTREFLDSGWASKGLFEDRIYA